VIVFEAGVVVPARALTRTVASIVRALRSSATPAWLICAWICMWLPARTVIVAEATDRLERRRRWSLESFFVTVVVIVTVTLHASPAGQVTVLPVFSSSLWPISTSRSRPAPLSLAGPGWTCGVGSGVGVGVLPPATTTVTPWVVDALAPVASLTVNVTP
jgi:hypothetical protein